MCYPPSSLGGDPLLSGEFNIHLRRSGEGRSPGIRAHGAPLFAWIPAYAGTTMYLSPAKFKAHGFSL